MPEAGQRISQPLDRRIFLKLATLLGFAGWGAAAPAPSEAVEPPDVPPWMKAPGVGMSEYGTPSKFESKVTRTLIRSQPGTTGTGASRTPLEALEGTITPSGLHFERHHSGVPERSEERRVGKECRSRWSP